MNVRSYNSETDSGCPDFKLTLSLANAWAGFNDRIHTAPFVIGERDELQILKSAPPRAGDGFSFLDDFNWLLLINDDLRC